MKRTDIDSLIELLGLTAQVLHDLEERQELLATHLARVIEQVYRYPSPVAREKDATVFASEFEQLKHTQERSRKNGQT